MDWSGWQTAVPLVPGSALQQLLLLYWGALKVPPEPYLSSALRGEKNREPGADSVSDQMTGQAKSTLSGMGSGKEAEMSRLRRVSVKLSGTIWLPLA